MIVAVIFVVAIVVGCVFGVVVAMAALDRGTPPRSLPKKGLLLGEGLLKELLLEDSLKELLRASLELLL